MITMKKILIRKKQKKTRRSKNKDKKEEKNKRKSDEKKGRKKSIVKRKKTKFGSLDIYINTDLSWQLEILREGNNLVEHWSRFGVDGKYKHIPRMQWLVVDFRSEGVTIKEKERHLTNVWIVVYDENYKFCRIYDSETNQFLDEPVKMCGEINLRMSTITRNQLEIE